MKKDEISFEAAMEQLEAIAQQLEDGDLGLEEALNAYEKGIGFLKQCHRTLQEAERKISLLTDLKSDGSAVSEPFDEDEAASLEEKQESRSRRRSQRSPDQRAPDQRAKGSDMDIQQGLF